MKRVLKYACTTCNLIYVEQHPEDKTNPSRGLCPRCTVINEPKVTREPDDPA